MATLVVKYQASPHQQCLWICVCNGDSNLFQAIATNSSSISQKSRVTTAISGAPYRAWRPNFWPILPR